MPAQGSHSVASAAGLKLGAFSGIRGLIRSFAKNLRSRVFAATRERAHVRARTRATRLTRHARVRLDVLYKGAAEFELGAKLHPGSDLEILVCRLQAAEDNRKSDRFEQQYLNNKDFP